MRDHVRLIAAAGSPRLVAVAEAPTRREALSLVGAYRLALVAGATAGSGMVADGRPRASGGRARYRVPAAALAGILLGLSAGAVLAFGRERRRSG